jgi:hypothetical protein
VLKRALGDGALDPDQAAGAINMNGFGVFQYGVDLITSGSSGTPPSSLTFSISGVNLDWTDLAKLSTIPPGDTRAIMAIDLFSPNANGQTGIVDLSIAPTPNSNARAVSVRCPARSSVRAFRASSPPVLRCSAFAGIVSGGSLGRSNPLALSTITRGAV